MKSRHCNAINLNKAGKADTRVNMKCLVYLYIYENLALKADIYAERVQFCSFTLLFSELKQIV